MAVPNKIIRNPKTGQDIRFIQTAGTTNGLLLEMESTYAPLSKEPPAHYHPAQVEDFTIITGELTVRIDGQVRVLRPGDWLHVPAGQVHAMWNSGQVTTVTNWKVRPALSTEHLLETIFGLTADGKTDKKGNPSLLQLSLTAGSFSNVFRLTKPPFLLQKIIFAFLAPVARMLGMKPLYEKYLN